MTFQKTLLFHPKRVPWISGSILGFGILVALPFIWMLSPQSNSVVLDLKVSQPQEVRASPLSIQLGLRDSSPILPFSNLQDEMSFSFDPPRPNGEVSRPQLLVHLKKSGESKRVTLPCRLDMEFKNQMLHLTKTPSSFWMEMALMSNGQIESRVFITSLSEEKIEAGRFVAQPEESPIRLSGDLSEKSPFRLLAEARWWGRDLFRELFGDGGTSERLEIGSLTSAELIEVQEGDWLCWEEGHWQKTGSFLEKKNIPIARIESRSNKTLILEGWDADEHFRLSLSPAMGPIFKSKGEDLFNFIRVRSERQVSCMLEKQCLILKIGDWILKTEGRWKILRKKEEKEAFLNGKQIGEIFVFERIDLKQGQKVFQGRLFNTSRSQSVSIEIPVQSVRKNSREKLNRKGRP